MLQNRNIYGILEQKDYMIHTMERRSNISMSSSKRKPTSVLPSDKTDSSFQLYPWQEECLQSWQAHNFHGIVNVITGAGKTVLALAASAYLGCRLADSSKPETLRTKIIVPSVPLALQWEHELKTILPLLGIPNPSCGLYYSGRKEDPDQEYMIYVLNSARFTAARHILADIRQGFHVLLIADECHRFASPENRRIFDFLTDRALVQHSTARQLYHSLGLSATPRVFDSDAVLSPALGEEIYRYSFASAVRDGHVSRFSIYHIGLSFSAAELRSYMDLSDQMNSVYRQLAKTYPYLRGLDRARLFAALQSIAKEEGEDSLASLYLNLSYKRKAVSCMASSRIACTLDLIRQLEQTAKILIFGERIQQAEQLYQALCALYPGRVGRYHSDMTSLAKKNTLEAYRSGSLRILVSCRGLDEGIDVPEASVGIVLSSSSVSRQRIQRLGRILRRREDKSAACLYYLYIRESSEDGVYLPVPDDSFPVCDLFYSMPDHSFAHPAYEEAAVRVLEEGRGLGLDPGQMNELRACLMSGLVRSDWLESPKICNQNKANAKSRHERNYWICMKRMANIVTSKASP